MSHQFPRMIENFYPPPTNNLILRLCDDWYLAVHNQCKETFYFLRTVHTHDIRLRWMPLSRVWCVRRSLRCEASNSA
jgi:hypothetical protein